MSHAKKKSNKNPEGNGKPNGRERKNGGTKKREGTPPPDETGVATIPGKNHPEWYNKFPTLLNNAASFWFANPLGKTVEPFGFDAWMDIAASDQVNSEAAVPGIMTFSMINAPGICGDRSDPVNTVASAMYNSVVYANSRSTKYDAPDLMQYVLVADSAYSFWSHLTRLYGIMNTYAFSNRYMGRYLVESLGFEYDTFRGKSLELKSIIDDLAFALGSICVPKDFDLFSRHIWMYGNLFVDSESAKAQLYAYKPSVVWHYNEMDREKGGALIPKDIRWLTLEDVAGMARIVADNLMYAQSLMNMAADIKRAYGDDKLFLVPVIPLDHTTGIRYDERMAAEMQNMTVLGEFDVTHPWNKIYADVDTNTLNFRPRFNAPVSDRMAGRRLINWPTDDPTPDDIMKISRGIVFGLIVDETADASHVGRYFVPESCGTELCEKCTIHRLFTDNDITDIGQFDITSDVLIEQGEELLPLARACDVSKFRWHPYQYLYFVNGQDYRIFLGVLGDVTNNSVIDKEICERLHRVALCSLLYNPNMGTFLKG